MEKLLRENHLIWSITAFMFMFAAFLYMKPSIAFGPRGSIKPFCVKRRECTIFPVWWWTMVFAAVSRIGVSYFANYAV